MRQRFNMVRSVRVSGNVTRTSSGIGFRGRPRFFLKAASEISSGAGFDFALIAFASLAALLGDQILDALDGALDFLAVLVGHKRRLRGHGPSFALVKLDSLAT
jgi:hypothetical protein